VWASITLRIAANVGRGKFGIDNDSNTTATSSTKSTMCRSFTHHRSCSANAMKVRELDHTETFVRSTVERSDQTDRVPPFGRTGRRNRPIGSAALLPPQRRTAPVVPNRTR